MVDHIQLDVLRALCNAVPELKVRPKLFIVRSVLVAQNQVHFEQERVQDLILLVIDL